MLAQEIIRRKRDGHPLERAQIDAFVRGLVDHTWSDAQAAAMAMAFFLEGMSHEETMALTEAMTRSGTVLDWRSGFPGPILDKHSSGGVGDKVSLVLAPVVAACGGIVPMMSGRGLGHTGGTLDKLESIPGYRTTVARDELEAALRKAGCAIVGASGEIAPADRRLYAIRDVTGTVESIPLICASITIEEARRGLDAMVLDIKVGNARRHRPQLRARWRRAGGSGRRLRSSGPRAWITDMNRSSGRTCGARLKCSVGALPPGQARPAPRGRGHTLCASSSSWTWSPAWRPPGARGRCSTTGGPSSTSRAWWRAGRCSIRRARGRRLPAAPVKRALLARRGDG